MKHFDRVDLKIHYRLSLHLSSSQFTSEATDDWPNGCDDACRYSQSARAQAGAVSEPDLLAACAAHLVDVAHHWIPGKTWESQSKE